MIYFFGQFFNLVTPLLVVPYIISVCGVENFGKSSVAIAFAFFIIVIIDFGSDIIGVKDVATNRDDIKKIHHILAINYTSRFLVLITLLLILTLLFLYIPFFNKEKPLFFLTLPILLGQYLNPTWFLQGLDQFRFISLLNIFSKIIYLIGIFVFIKKPEHYIYINLFWGF
jgi:O-antigen/teichoic acid export membrane protein